MKISYETTVTSQGGRSGHVHSNDGVIDMKVSLPKVLGGDEKYTNPEQLFAAGYSACFENAVIYLGRNQKMNVQDSKVTATVKLIMEGGVSKLAVHLLVGLPHMEKETAKKLVDEAHKICPYSKATRGNIEVILDVE